MVPYMDHINSCLDLYVDMSAKKLISLLEDHAYTARIVGPDDLEHVTYY